MGITTLGSSKPREYSEDVIVRALRRMLRHFEEKKLPETATQKALLSWFSHELAYCEMYPHEK